VRTARVSSHGIVAYAAILNKHPKWAISVAQLEIRAASIAECNLVVNPEDNDAVHGFNNACSWNLIALLPNLIHLRLIRSDTGIERCYRMRSRVVRCVPQNPNLRLLTVSSATFRVSEHMITTTTTSVF
jgi:hypothetical protein